MVLRVIVLVSCSLLVSSQSGAPIAAQTYPIYQQNGFPNPYPNAPNEFTPYHQAFTIQNPSALANQYPSIIREVLLNKFLSNPPAQTNLDPNIRSYGSNFDGYQNNQITPNLLNKYLAPSPYLNTNDANRGEINEKDMKETPKENKKKSSRKKRKHGSKDNTETSQTNVKDNKVIQQTERTTESQRTSRRKSRKHKTQNSDQDPEPKAEEETNTERTRKRKHKEEKPIENQPNVALDKVENPKPKKRRRHRRPKQDLDKGNNAEEKLTLRQKTNDFNLDQASGTKEENRFTRNSQMEQRANDTTISNTKAPENITSLSPSTLPIFDNPIMNKLFGNYGQFYPIPANNMTVNEKRPQNIEPKKPKRKRTNRRRNNQNSKNSTQTNPKIKEKVDTVTTEAPTITNGSTQMNVNSNKTDESLKSIEENKVNEENETLPDEVSSNTQDINENINYPYEGYFDDYYPQFTDNAYNANNKENYVKVLDNDKYFYATDDEIKNLELPERKVKDYELNKQYDEIEERLLKIDDNDNEIEFKTPPTLEKPDFETRPITRSEVRPEIYYKKEETQRFVGDKSVEMKQRPNFKPAKELETVYSNPKVVKYGATRNSEEVYKGDWTDTVTFDGLTYVFAKPMEYSQEEW